jgi:polysaccharide chain length determinant protein (PEP-CTERM system associated)
VQVESTVDGLAKKPFKLGKPQGPGAEYVCRSYENNDPRVAHGVVRSLLDTFMEGSLGMKRTDAGVAQRFLQAQLTDYEARLTEAEQRLATFKQQNVGLLPGFGGDYYQRLEVEMGTLQQMQQRISQLTQRRNELQRQLDGEEPTFGLMGSAEGSPIDGQIARYKAQLDQLLLQYTEKHPQVQSIKETIAHLEKEKRAAPRFRRRLRHRAPISRGDQALVRSLDMNPVYQNLRLALSQADADIAELRGQMASRNSGCAD